MSNHAQKKERQRLKRKQKREQWKRRQSGSPYKLISQRGEVVECWINSDWRERGQASAFVVRRNPTGGMAVASFFVDLWCAGLKDAWGLLEADRERLDRMTDNMDEQLDGTLMKVDLDEIRQVVAGALRFAKRNGFRLPRHYDRWTAFLGDLGDWQHQADLTHFGVDGDPDRLRWVAPMEDLRRRLIGSTVEEFCARPDIEFIVVGEGAPFDGIGLDDDPELIDEQEDEILDDDDLDDDELESLNQVITRAVKSVHQWCLTKGLVPHPLLAEAITIKLAELALLREAEMMDQQNAPLLDKTTDMQHKINQSIDGVKAAGQNELQAAQAQLEEYFSQLRDPTDLSAVLGLDSKEDEA